MSRITCKTCRFFEPLQSNNPVGACHAGPPSVVLIGMTKHPLTQQPIPVTDSFWPQVHEDRGWCGMHSRETRSVRPADIDLSRLGNVPELAG